MFSQSLTFFSKNQTLELSQAIWSWKLCDRCEQQIQCSDIQCSSHRIDQLSRYFTYYRDLVNIYVSYSTNYELAALRTHQELFRLIELLRAHPELNRAELTEMAFQTQEPGTATSISIVERERAINLAARAMTMISCTSPQQSLLLLEHGLVRTPWQANTSLSQFVMSTFPSTNTQNVSAGLLSVEMKSALLAWKLKKRAGLRLVPTDDLANHLKLDRRNHTLDIFHHTAFLKESLRATKDFDHTLSISECLKLGALPRQIALEALETIQGILFPLDDSKSCSFLSTLIESASFDPDAQDISSAAYRRTDEREVNFQYFGSRLRDLYDEVIDPSPQNMFEKWVERKKGARYVMMATLTGVVIAIILGILTLGVSGYQAWVGYQQWQHPKGG